MLSLMVLGIKDFKFKANLAYTVRFCANRTELTLGDGSVVKNTCLKRFRVQFPAPTMDGAPLASRSPRGPHVILRP